MINFLDTSAILNGALRSFANIYISPLVLSELEAIKTGDNNEYIRYLARQAVRDILNRGNVTVPYHSYDTAKIRRFRRKHKFLSDINDHNILCEAAMAAETEAVTFVTSDAALFLFANRFVNLQTIYFNQPALDTTKVEEYKGWDDFHPVCNEMAQLYSNPEINTLHAKTNEFCKIYDSEGEMKDVLFWDGKKYGPLKYKEFNNAFGEHIAPRNLEQKFLFHLLQNEDVKVKLCIGGFGTGKTYTMLQHAIDGVRKGRFSKIVYVRNNIITKGSRDVGYLSGSLCEKLRPYLMPIADLTTPEYMDELIETGVIEPVPLAFMRGRDFSNGTLVFIDEAENLTKENIQLLVGRIGSSSELWIAGDLKQIDHKMFEENNGLRSMINRLSGQPLYGMVRLQKAERSTTSQLADLMD